MRALADATAIRRASSRTADFRTCLFLIGQYLMVFFRFPRENAAADHEPSHCGSKDRKLDVLHRGVLRRLTPPRSFKPARALSLAR
jgi:hypothetical protein